MHATALLIDFLLVHISIVVGVLLSIIGISLMFSQKKSISSTWAWLIAMLLIPYVSVPIYIIFDAKKTSKRQKKIKATLKDISKLFFNNINKIDKVIKNEMLSGISANNTFSVCKNGAHAYNDLIKLIDGAKKYIYISTYVFSDDSVSRSIINALCKKSKEGIRVRLLIDSFGSLRLNLNQKILKPLTKAGGVYSFFMPILNRPFRNHLNLRNHRKIISIDGCKVLSGGMNISSDYMAPKEKMVKWTDLSFVIEGDGAYFYTTIFISDWENATGEKLPSIKLKKTTNINDAILQVVPSGPDVPEDILYESILIAIFNAKKKIWILTPYLTPNSSIMQALVIAKHRGLDVRLITPKKSNHKIADLARESYMRELKEEDIRVSLYYKKMVHAKAILIDDNIAIVGSANLDIRSLFINYEVMSYVYSKEHILKIQKWVENLFKYTQEYEPKSSRIHIFIEKIFKLIGPLL